MIKNKEILEKINQLLEKTSIDQKMKKLLLFDKYDSFDSILENLGKIRKDRGITLREAAERTKLSNSYISQIEQGKVNFPNLTQINKLLKAYGISISQLFVLDFINGLIGEDTYQIKDLQPDVKYIAKRYKQLSLKNRETLRIVLDALLAKQKERLSYRRKNSFGKGGLL